jgi:integrase
MVVISNFQILWRRVREALGLADFRLHDLRHTYATKLVRKGVPLIDVSKLLGHSTLRMTLRYAFLALDELDAAVDALDDGPRVRGNGHRLRRSSASHQ